jgi:hypothetical protein
MKTPQLIKTLFAAAVLLSALSGIAQTNATYLNIRSMTVGTPATLDYMIFGKASGTNYYWNRQYVGDFYNAVTNFPAGAWLRSNVVLNAANLATETAARIAASNSISASVTNEAAARVATSNALQSAISSATAQTLAGSNALSLAISNTAAAAYPSNNPNGFQTASQVAAAAASAAAQAVATGTTTGASVTFSAVKYVVLDKGTNNSPVIDRVHHGQLLDVSDQHHARRECHRDFKKLFVVLFVFVQASCQRQTSLWHGLQPRRWTLGRHQLHGVWRRLHQRAG